MNWFDIVVIGILAACAIRAYKKGVLKTVVTFAVAIVAFLMTTFVSPILCNMVTSNEKFMESVTTMIEEKLDLRTRIEEQIHAQTDGSGITKDFDVEKFIDSVATYVNVPKSTLKVAKKELKKLGPKKLEKKLVSTISYSISYSLATSLVRGACFIILYALTFVILGVVAKAMNLVGKLPGIRGLNKLAGAAIGLAEGILLVWLIEVVLFLAGFSGAGDTVGNIVEGSLLGQFFYDHNPILSVMGSLFVK